VGREAKYKHLEDDSKISGIGSLFRGRDRKYWSVNLNFFGNKSSKSLHFSAVPILARRRVLNPTSQYGVVGKLFKFKILNAQGWENAALADCPAYPKAFSGNDSTQYCFVAQASGKRVYIPQLEMARVLFYHDPFMARLSLQHDALSEYFYVDFSEEKPQIYIFDEADYPLQYFNRDDNRRFLSWLLMDSHARTSFQSISTKLLTKGYERGNYERWDFQFTPPPLAGVEIEVSGWDDRSSNSFCVWEIRSLRGLPSSISGEVDFIHPKFERKVGGTPTQGDGPQGEAPEDFELDDEHLTDTDKATMQLMSESVSVSFKNPFITNRISKRTRFVTSTSGNGEKEVLPKDLSVNEKEVTGALPSGAWNNLDDQTEDAHLYLSKFQSFLEMVAALEFKHGCDITRKITVKLPRLGESKKHRLSNTQNPRCLAIVELIYENQPITLLEVDTSDGAAKLSTMMLKTKESGRIMDIVDQVRLGVMEKSLGWPTDLFGQALDGGTFKGIPHPKSKHPGALPPEEIGPWAQRFVNWMDR
jgi:TnsE C-terminal domain